MEPELLESFSIWYYGQRIFEGKDFEVSEMHPRLPIRTIYVHIQIVLPITNISSELF